MKNKFESLELGQFIPLHYHHNMLNDTLRMKGFREAINLVVKPGAKVLELGGGTGVQSFFAAQKAQKVYCVERNPELVSAARSFLAKNINGGKVEVIQADALHYLPPEPVDVVICEMLHTGLLREKQMPVIDSFKKRYWEKFGSPLPVFVPEASIQAIQPIEQNFHFEGFYAPTILFQDPCAIQERSKSLGNPEVFQLLSYAEPFSQTCHWDGEIIIAEDGQLNALRLITKNILAINMLTHSTVDWHTQYIIVPLSTPIAVSKGDHISIRFSYQGGAPLNALSDSLEVRLVSKRVPVFELALEALNYPPKFQSNTTQMHHH
ncbi:methyltransferase domain-containing protein [Nitrosomonas sp.]|jgi:protein arginine N-methyltransferase 1|uniref:methyltransferase domain-containing protein n=1 Tax=Nitrosomonas sp. TaxID=42353 RepID=UPI002722BDC4|nr:methyltransferase domain-containing protein [Nitrosomonas sp.]MDO8893814.1 methyltransferase domain-containing protein [Nitrosomonas sp.]MDP1788142.1 methyltransferase domain-containing protein [Nitrosomonas sp.]